MFHPRSTLISGALQVLPSSEDIRVSIKVWGPFRVSNPKAFFLEEEEAVEEEDDEGWPGRGGATNRNQVK